MFIQRLTFALTLASLIGSTAQAAPTVKIGVLNDQSGPYATGSGQGSVLAAKMAVEDFEADKKGWKVDVIFADHKNKPDIGTEIAKNWFDNEKVDVIADVPNSGVAFAINTLAKDKNKVFLGSGPASSDLTGKACTPNSVQWTYDTWALANGTGSVIVLTGGKTWFFVTADYAFGAAMQRDTEAAVLRSGGQVIGSVKHPLNNPDMAPYIKQAIASKAKIIGLANAGDDFQRAIKEGAKQGLVKGGQQFAGMLVFLSDIHSLGLENAQGLFLTAAFYWDLNPKTRAWSKRFLEKYKHMPTMIHAGTYGAVYHYLKAVEAVGSAADGAKVVAKMKELPTSDALFGYGKIRKDGRKIHRLYLFEVKAPSESRYAWDYYKLRGIVPADTAFRPERDGGCPLVK